MININNSQVDSISKELNSKQNEGKSNSTLYEIFAKREKTGRTNKEQPVSLFSLFDIPPSLNLVVYAKLINSLLDMTRHNLTQVILVNNEYRLIQSFIAFIEINIFAKQIRL